MKKIEQIYSKLKEIEQTLTNAILYHEKNPIKSGKFFKVSLDEMLKNLDKINALKSIRFGVRMLLQSVEEIINENQNNKELRNE